MNNAKWLDEREFYDYCQAYRLAPADDPAVVVAQFEALKRFIRKQLAKKAKKVRRASTRKESS